MKGLVLHARETTVPGAAERTFTPLPATSIPADACFVLTSGGDSLCEILVDHGESHPDHTSIAVDGPGAAPTPPPIRTRIETASPDKPTWDPHRRELRFRDQVVKRYRVPAPNQELILTAFEEDGWPDSIDDPLPPVPDVEPKRRLQATVKSLNRSQSHALLTFHGNGGQRVLWESLPT